MKEMWLGNMRKGSRIILSRKLYNWRKKISGVKIITKIPLAIQEYLLTRKQAAFLLPIYRIFRFNVDDQHHEKKKIKKLKNCWNSIRLS